MEARQQRIAEMVRNLLPCIEECRRKQRMANSIIIGSILCYAMLGGLLVREFTRTIDTSEYSILSSVIALTAQENKVTANDLVHEVSTQFEIAELEDLKARHWNNALKYLANKTQH
jgi:hypothetical protein